MLLSSRCLENRENQTEKVRIQAWAKVARERFELSSAGPKPAMLDHYTTGLQHNLIGVPDDKVLRPKLLLISILRF